MRTCTPPGRGAVVGATGTVTAARLRLGRRRSERADDADHLGDHADAVDVAAAPGAAAAGVGQVDLHHVAALPAGQPDADDPGVGGQARGQRALGRTGGGRSVTPPMVPLRARGGQPALPGQGRQPGDPLGARARPSTVASGLAKVTPRAAVPAGGAAGEEQAERRAVPAAPDDRAAVAAGAERPAAALRSRSGRRSGAPRSSYWTATPSTSTAVIRPRVCPVVRPSFSTSSSGSMSRLAGHRRRSAARPEGRRARRRRRRPGPRRRRPPGSRGPARKRSNAVSVATRSAGAAAVGRARLQDGVARARPRRSRPARGCWTGSRARRRSRTKPPSVPAVTVRVGHGEPGAQRPDPLLQFAGAWGRRAARTRPMTRTSTSAAAAAPQVGQQRRGRPPARSRTATRARPGPAGVRPDRDPGPRRRRRRRARPAPRRSRSTALEDAGLELAGGVGVHGGLRGPREWMRTTVGRASDDSVRPRRRRCPRPAAVGPG